MNSEQYIYIYILRYGGGNGLISLVSIISKYGFDNTVTRSYIHLINLTSSLLGDISMFVCCLTSKYNTVRLIAMLPGLLESNVSTPTSYVYVCVQV